MSPVSMQYNAGFCMPPADDVSAGYCSPASRNCFVPEAALMSPLHGCGSECGSDPFRSNSLASTAYSATCASVTDLRSDSIGSTTAYSSCGTDLRSNSYTSYGSSSCGADLRSNAYNSYGADPLRSNPMLPSYQAEPLRAHDQRAGSSTLAGKFAHFKEKFQ